MEIKEWLEKRIAKTEQERNESNELEVIVGKGAKLKTYKEVLEFVNSHTEKLN